jgi:hypothetical protein
LKEYKFPINSHSGKANIIVDNILSRKVRMARLRVQKLKTLEEVLLLEAEVGIRKRFP